jgi:hypothetical protein
MIHDAMLSPKKPPTAEDLRRNILSTYFFLRTGIVALALLLPTGIFAYTLIVQHKLEQTSLSAFYGAYGGDMQNWFVGILCAIGAFLILYKGFTFAEDMALNAAGLFSILTAITPCSCWDKVEPHSKLHSTFAILFFACMAYVCFFCARNTISLLPDKTTMELYRRKYRQITVTLIGSPVAAVLVSAFATGQTQLFLIAVETIGIAIFAYYWYTKTREFKITSAEKKALRGDLEFREGTGFVETGAGTAKIISQALPQAGKLP